MEEAPEKIYIQPNAHDGWFDIIPNSDMLVEYVRKDAFIEKACEFIAGSMICGGYTLQTKAKFIRNFKKYMEG